MRLGFRVDRIRRGQWVGVESRRQWLDSQGFVWDGRAKVHDRQWELLQRALLTHKKVSGHLLVHREFQVPPSVPWAEEIWGMNLGRAVSNIRKRQQHIRENRPELGQWLDDHGFVWYVSRSRSDRRHHE